MLFTLKWYLQIVHKNAKFPCFHIYIYVSYYKNINTYNVHFYHFPCLVPALYPDQPCNNDLGNNANGRFSHVRKKPFAVQ